MRYGFEVGEKYNKLTIIELISERPFKDKKLIRYVICKCDCGNVIKVTEFHLRPDKKYQTKACKTCSLIKHGDSKERLYQTWADIKSRCSNKKHKWFSSYGGRGITLFEEWNEYKIFKEWAILNGYKKELQIERIDNNKGYYPDNCKWATNLENMANRRNSNVFVGVSEEKKGYSARFNYEGKKHTKYFAFKKYGKEQAYELAKQSRLQMEKEHNIVLRR